MSLSLRIAAVTVLLLASWTASGALRYCGNCPNHFLLEQSDFPFSEDIELTAISLTTNWQTVATGCASRSSINYSSDVPTNALLRAYLEIRSGNPGVRYDVRFVSADGSQVYGWYTRQIKNSGLSQGEFFFTTLQNIPAGQRSIHLQVRLLDSNQAVTAGTRWMSVQGAPSDSAAPGSPSRYPSDSQVRLDTYTITGQWSAAILPTITFHNTEPVDIFPQAYAEFTGGTAGDQVSFGFQLDSEPTSRRNSDVAVPNTFPGFGMHEGVNITDHLENVPPGTHTLKLWAISRSGRPVTVAARALQLISFPLGTSTNGLQFTQYPLPAPYVHPAATIIDSSVAPVQSPKGQTGLPFGYWYPVSSEFSFAPAPAGVHNLNWTGGGWIEILGRSGTWAHTGADLLIETYHYDPVAKKDMITDMMWIPVNIPPGRGHIYFFTDAFNWSNTYGNKIRIWMRKVIPVPGDTFTIGKVYSAMKLVPMTNGECYYTGLP